MEDQTSLLPAGRKAELAAYVSTMGQVTVKALADKFGVSVDTIRRDLDQLDSDGVLIRTHGGAVSLSALPRPDTGVDVRMRLQPVAKERIGAAAAGLVDDGSVIILNAGTTTLAVARHLRNHRELTIATNSLRIPLEISENVFRYLYLFGGDMRLVSQATIGPVGFRSTNGTEIDIQCDLALIAVGGVDPQGGYSTSNLAEAEMMREMMLRASKVAILADHSKIGRRLFVEVAALHEADYFVTDRTLEPEVSRAFEAAKVKIVTPETLHEKTG